MFAARRGNLGRGGVHIQDRIVTCAMVDRSALYSPPSPPKPGSKSGPWAAIAQMGRPGVIQLG